MIVVIEFVNERFDIEIAARGQTIRHRVALAVELELAQTLANGRGG
jgi:hypothetical protein